MGSELNEPTIIPHKPPAERNQATLLQRMAMNPDPISAVPEMAHTGLKNVLHSPGRALDSATQAEMGARFGQDFSRVRVHDDASAGRSAQAVNAQAYTTGQHMVFGAGRYSPGTPDGRQLIAHELAHVVQQGAEKDPAAGGPPAIENRGEGAADRAAEAAVAGRDAAVNGQALQPQGQVNGPVLQRKVEMRDVGRGEQSGFARLPELIDRLNAMSTGLIYAMDGRELTYTLKPGGTLSGFDRQMMAFIDQDALIPLRLTNRHGLLGDRLHGYNDRVAEDAWSSGYVDIDDLLASDDLGLQSVLVHFIRERTATPNYAHRIGSPSLDTNQPGPQREFERVHARGIAAETQLMRDFFGDPTIHIVPGAESGEIFRVYRNSRGDRIRTRVHTRTGRQAGVDVVTIIVILRDGRKLSAEEYRQLLENERITQQRERERLMGATEYRAGGRSIPAP